jgi:hypothetical protein
MELEKEAPFDLFFIGTKQTREKTRVYFPDGLCFLPEPSCIPKEPITHPRAISFKADATSKIGTTVEAEMIRFWIRQI